MMRALARARRPVANQKVRVRNRDCDENVIGTGDDVVGPNHELGRFSRTPQLSKFGRLLKRAGFKSRNILDKFHSLGFDRVTGGRSAKPYDPMTL